MDPLFFDELPEGLMLLITNKTTDCYIFQGSRFTVDDSRSQPRIQKPVGLGAGFDKNAKYLRELETLGFGFIEIGTVTPLPQEGNPSQDCFGCQKTKHSSIAWA
jgi:dihydroorotate dehydrogenase